MLVHVLCQCVGVCSVCVCVSVYLLVCWCMFFCQCVGVCSVCVCMCLCVCLYVCVCDLYAA